MDNIVNSNNYSYSNQFLIWLQNPTSEYVVSLRIFNDMRYKVKNDEKDIKILVPSFFKFVKIKLDNGDYEIKPYSLLSGMEKQIYKDKNDNTIINYEDKLGSFKVGTVFDIKQTNMPMEEINSHLKDNNQDYKNHRNKYESEAESIAYVVSKYLGLDTREYSTMYLYAWSKERDFKEIDASLNTIVNYSKKIIKSFELMYEKDHYSYFDNIST